MVGQFAHGLELDLVLLRETLHDDHQRMVYLRYALLTFHVWCNRAIVDESSAASTERDVLKLFNAVQR